MNVPAVVDTYEHLRLRALDRIRRDGIDVGDGALVRALLRRVVEDYQVQATSGGPGRPLADPPAMVERLESSVLGFGPLTPFIDGTIDYEELIIHGEEVTYVDADGRMVTHGEPISADEVRHVVTKLLATVGASVDEAHPIVQTQVLDGQARLGVVIAPVATEIDVTLRRYRTRRETFEELVAWNALSPAAAAFLSVLPKTPTGIVVTGQPGAGKTTMVNALLRAAPPHLRVIACEDTPELSTAHLHAARWRTRPAGPDGSGAVELRDLVRVSLGMRPDLLVVGETRGGEAYELTRAGNAGCGMITTLHANGAREGLSALVSTAVMAAPNVQVAQVRDVFSQTIDVVVHVGREVEPGGGLRRQVVEIVAVPAMQGHETEFTVEPIFTRDSPDAPLRWTGAPLPVGLEARIDRALRADGTTVHQILELGR